MSEVEQILHEIVVSQPVAALGTIHHGEPFVSMVPFALLPDRSALVIHVSQLAAHTRDMLVNPRVSLLITALPASDVPAQALPRVTVRADAGPLAESAPDYAAAREAYLAKFPHSAGIFELGDFSLFLIRPVSFRVIAGFGSAATLPADALTQK